MNTATELGRRIADLRRRHFGSRGRAEFARLLQVDQAEYLRYERGRVPPGDVLVRMCETTGEDLQWLLTGVAGRGTMVISGARDRHQRLIESVARLLEGSPDSAGPLEAFVTLLAQGAAAVESAAPRLPEPPARALIPVVEDADLPIRISASGESTDNHPRRLPIQAATARGVAERRATVVEPNVRAADSDGTAARIVMLEVPGGGPRECVEAPSIATCFSNMFAVRISDEAMAPLFRPGDLTLLSSAAGAQLGRPAVFRVASSPRPLCRVWLGENGSEVLLGRLSDGGEQAVPRGEVQWSLEALYRVRPAA